MLGSQLHTEAAVWVGTLQTLPRYKHAVNNQAILTQDYSKQRHLLAVLLVQKLRGGRGGRGQRQVGRA